jgi:hypothetical protein
VQAVVLILMSLVANSTTAFDTLARALNTREARRPLAELSSRLGLVRRFIRSFRFLDAFTDSYKVFTSLSGPVDKDGTNGSPRALYLEKTLDGLTSTFNGLYLLLEAMTLVDALGVQSLEVVGAELGFAMKMEAQRCWFVALAFGALSCVLKLLSMRNVTPAKAASEKTDKTDVKASEDKPVRAFEETRQTAKMASQRSQLSRKLIANLLDMPLPGSIVGWIPASESTVGLLMLTTSLLTGYDVWERCGREVGKV